jgi:predicted PurR-regulated permease PerM
MDERTPYETSESGDEAEGRASTGTRAKLAQYALIGIFLILFTALLSYGRGVFLPITLALVIGTILAPITNFGSRYGIPHAGTAAFLVLGTIGLLSTGIVFLADPAPTCARSSSYSTRRLKRGIGFAKHWARHHRKAKPSHSISTRACCSRRSVR